MLPKTLALVDDDIEYSEFLAQHLRARAVEVQSFADSSDLLAAHAPFYYDFYVVDLMLPSVDGVDLLKILRKRTQAGVLVVSGRLEADTFAQVINAGADMYLNKPVTFEQVELAIRAVHRRITTTVQTATAWKLDVHNSALTAPDGNSLVLSPVDLSLMTAFLSAQGAPVSRETLYELLELKASGDSDNTLHATIYRLRRRIERTTPLAVPLQSQQRIGYVFRAPLVAA